MVAEADTAQPGREHWRAISSTVSIDFPEAVDGFFADHPRTMT
jgi:hypothetical protein